MSVRGKQMFCPKSPPKTTGAQPKNFPNKISQSKNPNLGMKSWATLDGRNMANMGYHLSDLSTVGFLPSVWGPSGPIFSKRAPASVHLLRCFENSSGSMLCATCPQARRDPLWLRWGQTKSQVGLSVQVNHDVISIRYYKHV